ncbi:MAG: aminotransferase class V-fold PLP-dependent enzyme [Rhodocyclaceae bacterium]|nr:aminotransferase class V-fold PLP-dependent enzyme [Rhodocyclaceae bacterium]
MPLDAAAFVPTNRLDLRTASPDFVTVSFLQVFGYPTGVGCLLVRNETLEKMRRRWFGGHSQLLPRVQDRAMCCPKVEAGFEDGTRSVDEHSGGESWSYGIWKKLASTPFQRRVRYPTDWPLACCWRRNTAAGKPWMKLYDPTNTTRCVAAQ